MRQDKYSKNYGGFYVRSCACCVVHIQRVNDCRTARIGDGHIAVAGDGQVTAGESVIMKGNAVKGRRIYDGKVVIGFAGTVADAFTLEEKFEEKQTT